MCTEERFFGVFFPLNSQDVFVNEEFSAVV